MRLGWWWCQSVDDDLQPVGITRIKLDLRATGKADFGTAGLRTRLIDLHGEKIAALINLILQLLSPPIEGCGGDFVQIAEVGDGEIGLLAKLDQPRPTLANGGVWHANHGNLLAK